MNLNRPLAAVSAAIMNSHQQVLLTLRSEKIRFPLTWCLPGGHVEGGESWVQTLKKEVEEEVGLKVIEYELLGIYSEPEFFYYAEYQPPLHYGVANFLVTKFEGEVTINDESVKWGWFHRNELPSPMIKSEPIKIIDAFNYQGKVFVR